MRKTLITIGICFLLNINNLFAQINIKKENGGFLILDGEKKVAFYQKEDISMNLESGRANFLHPVYLPDGTVITENAPEDHMHHRGIFWAWHQIMIGKKLIGDPWLLKDFIVDVKSVEFKRINDGNGFFETQTLWKSPEWESGEIPYMEETTHYTFYKQTGNYRRIKINIELAALADSLRIGGSDDEKGYGGFSVRMKLPDDVRFSNEQGEVEPQDTAVEAGNYVNISGSVGKKGSPGGVLIYADPDNQSSPQSWILRKKDSMQNAVFPGREPVDVKKGTPLKLSYTLVLYNGRINESRVLKEITKEQ